MDKIITISHKELSLPHILELLRKFDKCFSPPFSQSIDLETYADKLSQHAYFIVAEGNNQEVGLLAYYRNKPEKELYVPYLVVDEEWQGRVVGQKLLQELTRTSHGDYQKIGLEVDKANVGAYRFYTRNGFIEKENRGTKLLMSKLV